MAVPPYVTAGTVIEDAWGDQIADAVVNPFVNAAARSAAITEPTTGMTTALTAANSLNGLEVYNGVRFDRPHNMPHGAVINSAGARGVAFTTSNSATTTTATDWAGLTVTFTAVANRIYRTTVFGMITSDNAVGTDFAELVITNNGNTVLAASRAVVQNLVIEGRSVVFIETGLTGSNVRKARLVRASGAGNVSGSASATRQASIVVEDLGPSGAPA